VTFRAWQRLARKRQVLRVVNQRNAEMAHERQERLKAFGVNV